MAGPIVPVAAVRNLELNARQGIEWLLPFLRPGAEDQNAGLMIRWARHVAYIKNQPKVPVIPSRKDDSPAGARADHRAVLDHPGVGLKFPTVQGFPVEERCHF